MMAYRLKILRGHGKERFWQTFTSPLSGAESVASALEELNGRAELRDETGAPCAPIAWDCACLEKKCGACAMVIGGTPTLACACTLEQAAKGDTVTLEPLAKFPRICDLRVDRAALFGDLRQMHLWLEGEADLREEERRALHYQAASCLLCGLCLEVCPNFSPSGTFGGALSLAAAWRVLDQEEAGEHRAAVRKAYRSRFFRDCAKSLSCQKICPAKLPIEQLMVKTNAAALWRRERGK